MDFKPPMAQLKDLLQAICRDAGKFKSLRDFKNIETKNTVLIRQNWDTRDTRTCKIYV